MQSPTTDLVSWWTLSTTLSCCSLFSSWSRVTSITGITRVTCASLKEQYSVKSRRGYITESLTGVPACPGGPRGPRSPTPPCEREVNSGDNAAASYLHQIRHHHCRLQVLGCLGHQGHQHHQACRQHQVNRELPKHQTNIKL